MKVYEVIREDSTIISTKMTLEEAEDCAIKHSNTCSSEFYIREKVVGYNYLGTYQLGKKVK